MAGKPTAEIAADEQIVRHLLVSQARDIDGVDDLPLVHVDDGWDCAIWLLGADLAVRLPRRAVAAPLIENEQRHLPAIAARLAPLRVPAPVVAGAPDPAFPWPWSVVPWYRGEPGLATGRAIRTGWAEPLAEALMKLHIPARERYPLNPYRGAPLAERDGAFRENLAEAPSQLSPSAPRTLAHAWEAGLAASPWAGPPLWIHGDLHPGNVVARGAELVAVIDFGDLTAGDPAYDLAVAWLAFDETGRARFRRAGGNRYSQSDWVRARAWAAAITAILLRRSDDNPAYRALGEECLEQLTDEAE